jgi:hypothetical protein
MSLSFADRRKKLQQRFLLETHQQSHQEAQVTPAAESADRSRTARAKRVRDLRQEREAAGSSAASGADNFPSPIPEQLLQLFKRIPQSDGCTCPAFVSMTKIEQDFMG